MNRKFGIIAAVACALVLCFALAGCGGGGKIDLSKFAGEWMLAYGSDENLDEESVELMKSLGLEVTLTLNEDETGTLNLFGEEMDVAWKATSATEGTISMEDAGDAKFKIDGDELVLSDDSSSMTFKKSS